jgi:hypothetical protein
MGVPGILVGIGVFETIGMNRIVEQPSGLEDKQHVIE